MGGVGSRDLLVLQEEDQRTAPRDACGNQGIEVFAPYRELGHMEMGLLGS